MRLDQQTAELLADQLCSTLGSGWTPRVWENFGWHYNAHSPSNRLYIHPVIVRDEISSYMAFLNQANRGGGRWVGKGLTPRAAMIDVIQEAQDELDEIEEILNGLREECGLT